MDADCKFIEKPDTLSAIEERIKEQAPTTSPGASPLSASSPPEKVADEVAAQGKAAVTVPTKASLTEARDFQVLDGVHVSQLPSPDANEGGGSGDAETQAVPAYRETTTSDASASARYEGQEENELGKQQSAGDIAADMTDGGRSYERLSNAESSAAEPITVARAASAGRVYTIQKMMRYAVKSQRPFHARVPIEVSTQGAASTQAVNVGSSEESLPLAKPVLPSGSTSSIQQHERKRREGKHTSEEDRVLEGDGRETPTGDSSACAVSGESGAKRLSDLPQGSAADASGAAQAPQGIRKSRQPPVDDPRPPPDGGDAPPSGDARGGPLLNAKRKLGRPLRAPGATPMQYVTQPDGSQRRQEAHPAWAAHAQCEKRKEESCDASVKGSPSRLHEELTDVDGGLAAFSMGDIRLAEKAVEGGMTLEGYFRSVKDTKPNLKQTSSDPSATGTPGSLPAEREQQHAAGYGDAVQSLWGPQGPPVSPQATVGLGGVPLENDVEEEFSILEETDFALGCESRGRGAHGSVGHQDSASAREKAAASVAAAQAAAAALSSPGAASVAAWFTAMLAGSPERVVSPARDRCANESSGNATCTRSQSSSHQNTGSCGSHSPKTAGNQRQEVCRRQQQPKVPQRGNYPILRHSEEQQTFQAQQHAPMNQSQPRDQLHKDQLCSMHQQRLHQQQAIRQHRGQPLDAAQGRQAGRQLLSLIGVVPASDNGVDRHVPSSHGCLPIIREEPPGKRNPQAQPSLHASGGQTPTMPVGDASAPMLHHQMGLKRPPSVLSVGHLNLVPNAHTHPVARAASGERSLLKLLHARGGPVVAPGHGRIDVGR
ncbi:hypothetical protein cyc_04803 [Cyclospora cayetanensis]|uniref:Uncharacterized protein n=1 Tax=Cyclospora cayetanensis TaxID=88456 RepID=A0A1D3CW56_9EIME|nr:hypothetical protein cyc_04803 [Cyclospora cayetanensis]